MKRQLLALDRSLKRSLGNKPVSERRAYCNMTTRSWGFRVSLFVLPAISPGLCESLSKSPIPVSQRSSRYFTQFLEILPLSSERNPSSSYGSSLPVCYTNSPRSLEEWIDENIEITTEDSGMTVGFDIEVSNRHASVFDVGRAEITK